MKSGMKRWAGLLVVMLAVARATGADFVLFYENDLAIEHGRALPLVAASSGALVSAQAFMAAPGSYIGDGQGLFRATLVRLDNDLNLAVVRKGDAVTDQKLVSLHGSRWPASVAFVGSSAMQASSPASATSSYAAPSSTNPMTVKINGDDGSAGPVKLKKRLNKARFKLEVVNTSTVPVWSVSLKLQSNPKLSFWKEGRRGSDVNDIPQPVFQFGQQALLVPIRPGRSVSVPVEAYFVKESDYVWTVDVKTKEFSQQSQIRVHIE